MDKFSHILCFVVLMLIQSSAYAQQLLNVRIGSDALVEEAIKDAIVVVESKYCIQDTKSNQKYGRNGMSYFNTLDFLGCKTDKGVIISEKALTPWVADNLFDKYRDNNKYRPLLDSTLVVRSLQIDTIQQIDITTDLSFNKDNTLICARVGRSRTDGLMVSTDDNEAINWIVWIRKSSKNESKESSNFEYNIIKKTVEFTKGAIIVDTPNSINSFIGGLYISAKVVSIGLVEFSLSGFLIENSGKWMIEPINVNTFLSDNEDLDLTSPVTNDSDDSLTPVKENSKEEKKKSKVTKKK